MTEPLKKGWCPGALKPMLSGDGWIIRIRPQFGYLSAFQMAEIAALAEKYGNGLIDCSTRANLQIRGVREENCSSLVEELKSLDLIDPTIAVENSRNVVVSPFLQSSEAGELFTRLKTLFLMEHPILTALPPKFGYALDCGERRFLAEDPADIRIERTVNGELIIRPDGCEHGKRTSLDQLEQDILGIADLFNKADKSGFPSLRMRYLDEKEIFKRQQAELSAPISSASKPPVGRIKNDVLAGIEFGRLEANTLASLARLCSGVRMTPWKQLLLLDCELERLQQKKLPGILLDNEDPHLRIAACTGAPACSQARLDTRNLARELAADLPKDADLLVSGCIKQCSGKKENFDFSVVSETDGVSVYVSGKKTDPAEKGSSASWIYKNIKFGRDKRGDV
ncbi:MAG: hypothetical protein MI743_04095 [Sneathiellales bacterium]|nr:hypothetical protein [Sneathiellales bacterium]